MRYEVPKELEYKIWKDCEINVFEQGLFRLGCTKARKTLQQENWIGQSYVAIDGEFGKEMYVYFRTKDKKFKPSKSQGDGLNWPSFLEKASNKGLVYRSDFFFFLDCVDAYLQLIVTESIVRLRSWI